MIAKDTQKPITLRKMKRMLKGRDYLTIAGVIAVLAFVVFAFIHYSTVGFDPEIMILWPIVGLGTLLITEIKAGRARRTIRRLRKDGELEAALRDLNGSSVHRIPYIQESSMQIAENVLGDEFIFFFSCGRIIRYSHILFLSVYEAKEKTELFVTDITGKTSSLFDLPMYRKRDIEEAMRQLKARYPDCPRPQSTDKPLSVL